MGRDPLEVVVHQRALEQVQAVGVLAIEPLEPPEHSLVQQHVTIDAKHAFALGLAKDQVAGCRRAHGLRRQDVAPLHRPLHKGPR